MDMTPLTDAEYQSLLAAQSDDEWNAACLAVKKARGGRAYSSDWYERVLGEGGAFPQFQARMGRSGSGINARPY